MFESVLTERRRPLAYTWQPFNTSARINASYKIIQSTSFPLSRWNLTIILSTAQSFSIRRALINKRSLTVNGIIFIV